MITSLLSHTNLSDYSLVSKDISQLDERSILVTKWNWDYSKCHAFQRHCLTILQEFPRMRIFIGCSHPRLFTNGRGLQKPKKGQDLNLVEFKKEDASRLPFPFFQIERGGGLTFHHPGQFIFYPILKLNPTTLSLSKMIDDIFNTSIEVLEDWGLHHLTTENALLGLWHKNQKLASMGIAIEKLATFHGMALNIRQDTVMLDALKALNPCGINAETYTSVEELISLPPHPIEFFSESFFKKVTHAWQ